ncbi:MAG: fatty acid desaturase [Amylibacter sp.]|nr:fatty acid desaturase [Amylibacter sp.]
MDHKAFLGQLSPSMRNTLTERSDTPALVHLALYWGMMLIFGLYIHNGLPFWGAVLIPQGILVAFNFTILHETIHATPFKTDLLNKIVGRITSFIMVIPMTWFRYFHLAHHRFTNDPENDPELNTPKPETTQEYIWHISGLPIWRGNIGKLIKNATRDNHDPYIPAKAKAKIRLEARIMLLLYVGVIGFIMAGYTWVLWCWILPAMIGQPFLRLYLLAEHGRCPMVTNMFENTRTTFTNRIVRFLAGTCPIIQNTTYTRWCRFISCQCCTK